MEGAAQLAKTVAIIGTTTWMFERIKRSVAGPEPSIIEGAVDALWITTLMAEYQNGWLKFPSLSLGGGIPGLNPQ